MLTLAPLPKWGALLRALVSPKPDLDKLSGHWVKEGEVGGWFSRSAWSFARIAKWRLTHCGDQGCSVWVPDYFCNSSLEPLRAIGVELIFYPVTKDMVPDFKACRHLAKEKEMDIFVIVHYFGMLSHAAEAKVICGQNEAWLVEDAAHVLERVSAIGKFGDFIIFSPHKQIALPDGALLVVCPKGPAKLGKDLISKFGDAEYWHEELQNIERRLSVSLRSSLINVVIWIVKRSLQKIGIKNKYIHTPFTELTTNLTDITTSNLIPASMSSFSQKLLARQVNEIPRFARLRRRNLHHWKGILARLADPLEAVDDTKFFNDAPYLAMLKLNVDDAQGQFTRLKSLSLPALTWPDLPPEVLDAQSGHEDAHMLRNSHVFFPLHQTITERDLCRLESFSAQPDILLQGKVIWNSVSKEEWLGYLKKTGKSNLLQSWEYGQAKQHEKNWHPKRGVLVIDSKVVAICQVLEKTLFGFLKLYRINRGPLFLNNPNESQVLGVFHCLKNELTSSWKTCLLFHAPERDLNSDSIILLSRLGYRLASPIGWESVWVDLNQGREKMRSQLDGKWRNMLVNAEKSGLSFAECSQSDSFEWLLNKCSEMMSSKKAGKVPIKLYWDLKRQLDNSGTPIRVFKAYSGNNLVAGICTVPHGNAETYLLGWNGELGRQLKANQFLLWHAMMRLKEQGVDWLDLGGISEMDVPGVTEFKLGINGGRYGLVGEYLCI